MSLWNPVYSVLLCYSVRNRTHPLYKMRRMLYVGEFFLSWKIFFFLTEGISFSHRTHRFNRPHLRTVSSTQNAFGIQISQNVTANENTNKEAKSSLYPAHRGISVITPLPFGGGEGGGASWGRECGASWGRDSGHHLSGHCVFCSSVLLCEKKYAPSQWEHRALEISSLLGIVRPTISFYFCHPLQISRK